MKKLVPDIVLLTKANRVSKIRTIEKGSYANKWDLLEEIVFKYDLERFKYIIMNNKLKYNIQCKLHMK